MSRAGFRALALPLLVVALLVVLAAGEHDGDGAPAHKPFIKTPLPKCHFHVFRHISKAAGTTMRFIFDKQVVMGDWEFRPKCEFGFHPNEWHEVLLDFRTAVKEARSDGPRVIVEIRNGWGATNYGKNLLRDIEQLREDVAGAGCQVTTSFLMRDPKAQFISFYRYYIKKMQVMKDGGPVGAPRGPIAWGKDFLDWVQQPSDSNIQVREVLGDKCTSQLRQSPFAVTQDGDSKLVRTGPRELTDGCQVGDEDVARFNSLVDSFDVVGTTGNFNRFWLRLADLVGFQHLEYTQGNKAAGPKEESQKWKVQNLPADWLAALEQASAQDQAGYNHVVEVEKRQLAEVDASFEGRFELYEGMAVDRQRKQYFGGEPPESKYKWVAKCPPEGGKGERCKGGGPAEGETIQPEFYTGQALCGRNSMEVVLAERGSPWRCARGCTFD